MLCGCHYKIFANLEWAFQMRKGVKDGRYEETVTSGGRKSKKRRPKRRPKRISKKSCKRRK